jgi:2'-5' RNA ligase
MLPGDRLVCVLLEPLEPGERFTQWPLHVTIVPWFRLDESSELIAGSLQRALVTMQPFEIPVVGDAMFGPRKNRPAKLLESPGPFEEIEAKVRNYLHKKRAWLVDETTEQPRQFRPHVTLQQGSETDITDVLCSRLYIVTQRGGYKQIAAIVPLGHQ